VPRDNIVRQKKFHLTYDRKEDRRDKKRKRERERERKRVTIHLTKNVEKDRGL